MTGKTSTDRLIRRFHFMPMKGMELGMPSLQKNMGGLEILLD